MRQQMNKLSSEVESQNSEIRSKNVLLSKEAEDELKWIEKSISPSLVDRQVLITKILKM